MTDVEQKQAPHEAAPASAAEKPSEARCDECRQKIVAAVTAANTRVVGKAVKALGVASVLALPFYLMSKFE